MDIFRHIAERRIIKAMEEGEFENLSGSGKPLILEDETWVPEDLRMTFRLLRNGGYIPPELELRGEIFNLKSLINTLDDDKERLKKIMKLNYKLMKLDMMRQKPLKLERFPEYEITLFDKVLKGER
jgi:hypothetical protein